MAKNFQESLWQKSQAGQKGEVTIMTQCTDNAFVDNKLKLLSASFPFTAPYSGMKIFYPRC
jgi:hypothetical protein